MTDGEPDLILTMTAFSNLAPFHPAIKSNEIKPLN